ncbi:MAG TPA: hypothetical protein VM554_07050 [Acidisarcina sp.]|nr:hypothetical protein [Acidisarcina sp.]
MKKQILSRFVITAGLVLALPGIGFAQTITRIQPSGTTRPAAATSVDALQTGTAVGGPEIDPAFTSDSANNATGAVAINRSIAKHAGVPIGIPGGPKFKSNPVLAGSFDGLNLYQQRFANGGNQFTTEPPDQGLCVGNGYVVESVNQVLRVFDTAGAPLMGAVDLNTFYGYAPAITRSGPNTGQYGPEITDPSCYFDAQTQRFYHVVVTLDRVGTTSALSGRNHLDLAVSNSSNPLGSWTIYKIDTTNDGNNGTPDHHCDQGFCFGDYPHIGADAYGFYITTNEFSLFGSGFNGAQIYAMSKRALAAGGPVSTVLFNTADSLDSNGLPGFTVWPAVSAAMQYDTNSGGTEFLLSSDAVFFDSQFDNRLRQWSLTNTSSLDSGNPQLILGNRFVAVNGYAVPPSSTQKAGDYPLGQSLGDPESRLDSNDSRMQQVYYANGRLWAALDTGVTFDGIHALAGAAYFVLNPNSGHVMTQGYLAVPNNNVTYPAIAATANGRGAMAFTLTGPDFYPSAGYASVDAIAGAGTVQLAAAGVGPSDGFTGYPQYSNRPRWGDYGAAVATGNDIWLASEYIGQSCTLAQWMADSTCGATRAKLGNWDTRISRLQIK